MMATKQQEREALEMIREIVEELGAGSYVGTAFEGCFEIAEENIENDFACSMKQRAESAEATMHKAHSKVMELKGQLKEAEAEITRLAAALDAELEWQDCEGGTTMDQVRYEALAKSGRQLTTNEAKELIYEEFGFAREKVTIITETSTYEKNRHQQMRKKQTYDRPPIYDASDWNYVRFNCSGWMYEMVNGELNRYAC